MTIGIIGAAHVGQAVAKHALATGRSVVIANSRGPASLADLVALLGPGAKAGTREEAASAGIVVLAAAWVKREAALGGLPAWDSRILVDATNAFLSYAPDFRRDDVGDRTSSEIIADLAPGARVVKCFNTLFYTHIEADPREGGGRRVLFLSGDDHEAKREVADLVKSFGFATIDLGGLVTGGRLQQLDGPLAGPNLIRLG